MTTRSTGTPDRRGPEQDRDAPYRGDLLLDSPRAAGSPPPAIAAPHEGLVGEPAEPFGSDPRPGNVGHAAEALVEAKDDRLDEAADESFPASDPPSWSVAPTTGEERPDPPATPGSRSIGLGRIVED
jgi:hypothetical protein